MTKGILLICYGKRGYSFLAYNLAFSIKRATPGIHITLLSDGGVYDHLEPYQLQYFDAIEELKREQFYTHEQIDPAKLKLNLDKLCPYDITLYLDVDNLAIKDLTPIFTELEKDGGYFYTHTLATHNISQGRVFESMIWAYADDIWQYFQLPDNAILPACNSSFQYLVKGEKLTKLFDTARECYAKPIPIDRLRNHWGGTQPDELYINIAMAIMGITGQTPRQYMFLAHAIQSEGLTELEEKYELMCLFGTRNNIRAMYTDWYDRLLIIWHQRIGQPHKLKYHHIKSDKHANKKNADEIVTQSMKNMSSELKPGILKLWQSIKVNSRKLIASYQGPKNNRLNVTNWFNNTIIEHRGKLLMCYRMEMYPFARYMKLGLCELDTEYQPLPDSNILLSLYSTTNGFHVEDPRFFHFNNDLFITYTDGYNVAIAKLNNETYLVEDSWYLPKPDRLRTEKNWTFFEHEGKLYCNYGIAPKHIIWQMADDLKAFTEIKHETDSGIDWTLGEVHGGNCPVLHENVFYSFFHSQESIMHDGHNGKQYFVGCYAYENKPPFKILKYTKVPLLAGEAMNTSIPRLNNRIYVVFAAGAVRQNGGWAVSYGNNDYDCRVIFVSDELLNEHLILTDYEKEEKGLPHVPGEKVRELTDSMGAHAMENI